MHRPESDDERGGDEDLRFVDPDAYGASDFADFRRRLRLQSHLDDHVPLRQATWYGTHNSYNTDDWSLVDDNQEISIYRQLDLGMRFIELDRHHCYGINTVTHATCADAPRPMIDALYEIRGWLDDNPDEFLVIMIEDAAGPDSQMVRDLRAIADLVYVPESCDGDDHKDLTKAELRAIGKRVILYGGDNHCGSQYMPHLEYAKLAAHSFHGPDLSEADGIASYPGCTYNGYAPRSSLDAAKNLHNSLLRMREDNTLNPGVSTYTNAEIQSLVDCGVPVVNFDDVVDEDMHAGGRLRPLVWSWQPGEPNNFGDGEDCATLHDGGFNDLSCEYARRYACQHRDNLGDWKITGQAGPWLGGDAACTTAFGPAYQFAVPKHGYEKNELAGVAGDVEVWLNYTDMLSEGEWVAGDNTQIRFELNQANLWAASEPNDHGDQEDCALVATSALLNDDNCGEVHRFMCVRRSPSGDEWVSSATSGTWAEGHDACAEIDASFSTPATPAELDAVTNVINTDGGSLERWVNLTDAPDEGVWLADVRVDLRRLGDGSSLPYHWGTNEPNNQGDERCVEIGGSITDVWMNDNACGEIRKFACKNIHTGYWTTSDIAGSHSEGATACAALDGGSGDYIFAAPSSRGDFMDIIDNDWVFVNLVRSTNQNGAWEWAPDLDLLPAGIVDDLRHIQASPISGYSPWGVLRNDQGLCLDIEGGVAQSGADVEQDICDGSDSQLWYHDWDDSIRPLTASDLCIDAEGGEREDGTALILWPCTKNAHGMLQPNQRWGRWIDGLFLMECEDEPYCALSIGWPAIDAGSDAILETSTGGESEPEMRWYWQYPTHY